MIFSGFFKPRPYHPNLKYYELIRSSAFKHHIVKRGTTESNHRFNKIKEVQFSALGRYGLKSLVSVYVLLYFDIWCVGLPLWLWLKSPHLLLSYFILTPVLFPSHFSSQYNIYRNGTIGRGCLGAAVLAPWDILRKIFFLNSLSIEVRIIKNKVKTVN